MFVVYKLNFSTGEVYIGMTADFTTRLNIHVLHLDRGDHHSTAIQRAWDENGSFDAEVVFSTDNKRLALDKERALQVSTEGSVHAQHLRKRRTNLEAVQRFKARVAAGELPWKAALLEDIPSGSISHYLKKTPGQPRKTHEWNRNFGSNMAALRRAQA